MKTLLTTLCLAATVFSTVSTTPPAHAQPPLFNPNTIATSLDAKLPPGPDKPAKAELVMTSWISGKGLFYQVNFLVQNTGDLDSGPFTTRISLRYGDQFFFNLHDVPMNLPARSYRLVTYLAYSPQGPQAIMARSAADIFKAVSEYNEDNNRSRINLAFG